MRHSGSDEDFNTGTDRPAAGAHPGAHPYDALTPEVILDAVERYGVRATGGLLALNSYENRVYRVDTEERGPLAAKFYRPGRFDAAAIREEHAFAVELAELEVPVVAPLRRGDGDTLARHAGFLYALYPWQPGRSLELDAPSRRMLGRFLGRLHRAGAAGAFRRRPRLDVAARGREPVAFLLAGAWLPDYLRVPFESLAQALLARVEATFAAIPYRLLRIHGDCHLSNLLWTEHGPHFVDFDDCMTGPAVQDLWMLLDGAHAERARGLGELLDGYREFADFDLAELVLIEPLRTLRLLHYSAWLARRWDDPAFPRAFPWFNTTRYWEDFILSLREQLAALDEPPLEAG